MGKFSFDFGSYVLDAMVQERQKEISSLTTGYIDLFFDEEIDYNELCNSFIDIAKSTEELFILGSFAQATKTQKEQNDMIKMFMDKINEDDDDETT